MPIPHRRIRGKLLYTSDHAGREGTERGREYFTLSVAADGRRTLRACTEIDDAPNVLRDVTLSLRSDWTPEDAFVRLSVGDRLWARAGFASPRPWLSVRATPRPRVESRSAGRSRGAYRGSELIPYRPTRG